MINDEIDVFLDELDTILEASEDDADDYITKLIEDCGEFYFER